MSFIHAVFATVSPGDEYIPNWHIEMMADYLEACRRREIKRLIINVPPRSLKSIVATVGWPAWLLGQNPAEKIIAASYSKELALKHSIDCRLVIEKPWYRRSFPKTHLLPKERNQTKFVTSMRGFRKAASTGGTVTGEGGHFLIGDDLMNPDEAWSERERESVNRWMKQTFMSRLDNKIVDVVVLVMQRLHEKDVAGFLLAEDGWELLKVPTENEVRRVYVYNDRLFGKKKEKVFEAGEYIHKERFNEEVVKELKKDPYVWAGQYQQEPAPIGGGIIKLADFKRYECAPEEVTERESIEAITISLDTANKSYTSSAYTAGTVWGEGNKGHFLLELINKKVEFPELKAMVIQLAHRWQPNRILIEDRASGTQLIQELRRMPPAKFPYAVIAINPKGDKEARMSVEADKIAGGRVWLPVKASWLPEFELQLSRFPRCENFDICDSVSQYLAWTSRRRMIHMAKPRNVK